MDLLSGLGDYLSPYHPQVLEFAGGILALVDKAKTTLETMATEAATESSLRSGSLLSPSRENSSLWFCPCPCPVICPLFLPCNFCPVNFALCFALLVFVLLFLPLLLGWYFHFHCGCCVRGHCLIIMIFFFQMPDLLLKTDGG